MPINYQQLQEFRKYLHKHPEISGKEKETSRSVYNFIKNCNPISITKNIGGYGILATWDSFEKGQEILFRAELDALPIKETNNFSHASVHTNVSHKCGHDGHSTILCGVAQYLSDNIPLKGKIHLLFQPAEENGKGAKAMLSDKKLAHIKPDFVFALHNLPGYPLNQIVVRENTFTAAVTSIIINLEGKTSHAAEPEKGINPAIAVAQIINESLTKQIKDVANEKMRIITPVYMKLGKKAYGISAGKATIHFTLRCWNDENLYKLQQEIIELSTKISKQQHLICSFSFTQTFSANINNKAATDLVVKCAETNNFSIIKNPTPFKWGEDFGLFTSLYKGCMFGIGSGLNTPALHNPDYDFPDELLKTGVTIFKEIITNTNLKN
ncbi:amidohydrolase [Lutibacter sp.]|uniref:amidohydrolase n=1 Tax=Lutibacter sp. TaxID=1925666 RepID=UPI003569367F